jgi:hypothetical protein
LNSDYVIDMQAASGVLAPCWDNNNYCRPPDGNDFRVNSWDYSFSDWRDQIGFDADGSYVVGSLTGTQVFIRSNRYETGRALMVVYNWDYWSSVFVDVSSVLPLGTPFEVRNVQDFYAPPVLTGTYGGEDLQIPMMDLTVASPNGGFVAPAPTGRMFNVFVILPVMAKLRATAGSGQVQIFWPTALGNYVLQSKNSFAPSSHWTAVTNVPTVVGSEYLVRDSLARQRLYRLISVN